MAVCFFCTQYGVRHGLLISNALGHYGPAFFDYFYKQNAKIQSGEMQGYPLTFNNLGIINGIVDAYIQMPYYPEFAIHNTYGIKAYNDTVYNYAKFAAYWPNGCLAAIDICIYAAGIPGGVEKEAYGRVITNAALSNPSVAAVCQEAADECRDNVEVPYYIYSGRNAYDIRNPSADPTPPTYFIEYLNQAKVQDAIGVSVNYTDSNGDIFQLFQVSQSQGILASSRSKLMSHVFPKATGDWTLPNFKADLEQVIASGVRVSMEYGDAD